MHLHDLLLHESDRKHLEALCVSGTQSVLIDADRGYGKRTIAEAFAKDITQAKPGSIKIVSPIEASITIDQIRDLKAFFTLKTHSVDDVRVAIIQDADAMTHQAQNSLLKLLEEPPEQCRIVLTSGHSESLLPTIISRVQTYRLRAISVEALTTYLISKGHKSLDIDKATQVTGGLVGATCSILNGEDSGYVVSLARAKELLGQKHLERLRAVEQLTKDKQSTLLILDAFKTIATAGIRGKAKNSELWTRLLKLSSDAEQQLSMNANTKLVLTNLFLSL